MGLVGLHSECWDNQSYYETQRAAALLLRSHIVYTLLLTLYIVTNAPALEWVSVPEPNESYKPVSTYAELVSP